MRLTVEITTSSTGFDDKPGHELARILRDLATRIQDANWTTRDRIDSTRRETLALRDRHGNTCGSVRVRRTHVVKKGDG